MYFEKVDLHDFWPFRVNESSFSCIFNPYPEEIIAGNSTNYDRLKTIFENIGFGFDFVAPMVVIVVSYAKMYRWISGSVTRVIAETTRRISMTPDKKEKFTKTKAKNSELEPPHYSEAMTESLTPKTLIPINHFNSLRRPSNGIANFQEQASTRNSRNLKANQKHITCVILAFCVCILPQADHRRRPGTAQAKSQAACRITFKTKP